MRKNSKTNFIFILVVLMFSSLETFSQILPKDSIMAINRKFNNEIGIDFKGFFKGEAGTSLIWKVKKKQSNGLISLTSSSNYRFQLAITASIPFNSEVKAIDTTFLNVSYSDYVSKNFSIKPMIGIERIKYFQRFNIFYGIDFGPYYIYTSDNLSNYGYYYNNNYYSSGYPKSSSISSYYGVSLAPFFGVKYRLNERFSISMESGINFSFEYLNRDLNASDYDKTNNIVNEFTLQKTEKRFLINMMYLRFLNLNYHF